MQLHVFPPDPKLAQLIMHILVVELDGCASHLPAALSPALLLIIRGDAQLIHDDGSMTASPRFFLRGPILTPANVIYAPDTLCCSVCFRPGMLHQASGISPAELNSLSLPMSTLFDANKVNDFLLKMDEEHTHAEYAELFQNFLLEILDHSPKKSMGAAFLAARQKLFFPLIDISQYFGIGQRQLERRVREAFGVSLRDVRRIVRFGQILPRMIDTSVGWGDLTRIAQDAGYYDQAHMHREFVELAGISPMQLIQKIASNDPAYWLYRLSERDFRNLFLPPE